jgi:hypothetical protein
MCPAGAPVRDGVDLRFAGRIAVLVAALMAVPPSAPADAGEQSAQSAVNMMRIDFESDVISAAPRAFTAALTGDGGPVRWVIVEDASAPAGPKVLAEQSADKTRDRFPIAILNDFSARNVEISVRFKPVSGTVDQAAGLMVRVIDPNNYYVVRANALEDNVRLYRVVNGRRVQFAGVDVKVPSSIWQELAMRIEGERITVSLNGKALFTATDRTFGEAGRVGLWTKADSVTHFDEVRVAALP